MTSTLFKLHRTLWWRTIKSNPTVLVAGGMILVYGLLSVLSMAFEVNSPEALHAPVAFGMAAMLIWRWRCLPMSNKLRRKFSVRFR